MFRYAPYHHTTAWLTHALHYTALRLRLQAGGSAAAGGVPAVLTLLGGHHGETHTAGWCGAAGLLQCAFLNLGSIRAVVAAVLLLEARQPC